MKITSDSRDLKITKKGRNDKKKKFKTISTDTNQIIVLKDIGREVTKVSINGGLNINQDTPLGAEEKRTNISINQLEDSSRIPKTNNESSVTKPCLTRCYSCGSLFSSDSSDCAAFNQNNADQQVTCKFGDACLYYAWKVSEKETGWQKYLKFQLQ